MAIQAGSLPELQIGVETPWPLKREGKQVYAKLLDFDGRLGQWVSTLHMVPDIEWKQISWDHSYIASSTDGSKRSLGLVSAKDLGTGAMPRRFFVDHNSVQVNMQPLSDYRDWDTMVVCLLYTKTSDGAASGELIAPGPDGLVLTSREGELVWEEVGSGCECEIATPQMPGLVPDGGLAGQYYGVNADGTSYGFISMDSRKVFTSHCHIYVSPSGDDANTGYSAASPWRSWNKVRQFMRSSDLRGNNLYINMLPGTYTEPLNLGSGDDCMANIVYIQGFDSDNWPVFNTPNATAIELYRLKSPNQISNIAFDECRIGIHVVSCAAHIGSVRFSNISSYPISAAHSNCVVSLNNARWTYSGSFSRAFYSWYNSYVKLNETLTIVFEPGTSFSLAAFVAWGNGGYYMKPKFVGSFTGRRYHLTAGGSINTERSGADFIPGSLPGVLESDAGCWYR